MQTFCQNCNYQIKNVNDQTIMRCPCPNCGSFKRCYQETVNEALTCGEIIKIKAYVGGLSKRKGRRFECIQGSSLSIDRGRFMFVFQLVDYENNRYIKKVIDPKTGEIIRNEDKLLSDHRDHGSAKKRDSSS